jgi:hypothetical protein
MCPDILWGAPSLIPGDYFPVCKASESCSSPLIFIQCWGQEECSDTSTPPYVFMAGRLINQRTTLPLHTSCADKMIREVVFEKTDVPITILQLKPFTHTLSSMSTTYLAHRYLLTATRYTRLHWDVAPCSLVEIHWRFRGTHCSHLQDREVS